eukprot:gene17706-23298_t
MKRKRVIDKASDKSIDKSINKQQTIKSNVNKQTNDESSDEYDSGEDVVKTAEDDAFIDQEDDQKYLIDEYDQDQQNFNDKPDNYIKKTKKKTNKSSSNTGSSNDPLSQTLQSLKKPKAQPISDADNSKFVTELLDKLSYARQSSLNTISDPKARVKTPYSNGFVFTVRPDSKTIEKRDINEERLGESRMKIFKLTKVKKGSNKDNFRAIQVDTSGRDKN